MTIRIQTYQSKGIKTDKLVDEFEFCCWDDLEKWLKRYTLWKCPKCNGGTPDKIEKEEKWMELKQ